MLYLVMIELYRVDKRCTIKSIFNVNIGAHS